MATAAAGMQQSFASTAAPRRKRIATYGKSRTRPFTFIEDTISPEKPKTKPTATSWGTGTLKKVPPSTKSGSRDKGRNAQDTETGVFDVPSSTEDELLKPSPPRKAPAKSTTSGHSKPAKNTNVGDSGNMPSGGRDLFDVPFSSGDEPVKKTAKRASSRPPTTSRPAKLTTNPGGAFGNHSAQPKPAKAARSITAPGEQLSSQPKLAKPADNTAKSHSVFPKRALGKAIAGTKKFELDSYDVPSSNEDVLTKKYIATPKRPSPLPKRAESKAPVAAKKAEYDMFDVPTTDDDEPDPQSQPKPRPKQASTSKPAITPQPPRAIPSPKQFESDSSTAAKKRKRYIPTSAGEFQGSANQENAYKDTVPVEHQRGAKHMRREGSASRDVRKTQVVNKVSFGSKPDEPEMVHKPQRIRTQTVPVTAPLSKGQSAPAKLHNMLAVRETRPVRYPSPLPSIPSSPKEDQIMENTEYTELLPSTPPRQATPRSPVHSGAVTPRQRELWNNLLGDPPNTITPGMLKIDDLRISERRVGGIVTKLGRSSSDIPRTSHTKRPRLIDSLMKSAPCSDDNDDSEEEGLESEMVDVPQAFHSKLEKRAYGRAGRTLHAEPADADDITEEMDLDVEIAEASQPSQSAPILTDGPKRTYAKQRSYLDEANLEAELLFSLPMETSPVAGNKRRGLNANPTSGLAGLTQDSDDDQPTTTVRSIHELRKGGEILRFRTDIEALLDDIKDTTSYGKARRRSAMLELAMKLSDAAVVHRVIELGLDHQLFSRLSISEDPIFNFTAAATITFVIKAGVPRGVLEHMYQTDAATCLAELLERDIDIARIAKERKSNLSKVAQGDVAAFRTVLQGSNIWKDDKPEVISPQLIGLRGLELLVRGLRKAGSKADLLDDTTVSRVLDSADTQVQHLSPRQTKANAFRTLKLCLSIMESLSLSGAKAGVWGSKSLRRLADIMPSFFMNTTRTESVIKTEDDKTDVKARLDRLAIRLVINLTNNNSRVCDIFSTPALVQPLCGFIDQSFNTLAENELDEGSRVAVLERLYLSLGAMINLAEFSDRARAAVCSTDDREGDAVLLNLVLHFLNGIEKAAEADSLEASKSNVAYGYLTVLLGNLCQNPKVKRQVVDKLPKQEIGILVDAINEFIEYNLKVDREANMLEGAEGREVWSGFTERLGKVVQRLVAV